MTSPESKDSSTALNGGRIREPVAHDSSSDGSTSGLEESKEKVDRKDEEVAEGLVEPDKVEPEGDVDQEKTGTTSKETNRKDRGRVEGISELSVDDVSGGVSGHENGVHLGQNERRKSGLFFKLLLDGRVTLSGEMRHEISSEGHEEGKTVLGSHTKWVSWVFQVEISIHCGTGFGA